MTKEAHEHADRLPLARTALDNQTPLQNRRLKRFEYLLLHPAQHSYAERGKMIAEGLIDGRVLERKRGCLR